MKVVIDISDEDYEVMKASVNKSSSDYRILDGIPLPKGHSRLIDEDTYFADVKKHYFDNDTVMRCTEIALSNAPTIIEADKIEPTVNGDWHYGSEPMQSVSYSDRTTIIEADKERKNESQRS